MDTCMMCHTSLPARYPFTVCDGCWPHRPSATPPPPDWRAIAEELAGAADEASEWMHANPPANGWGLLDRGADADSKAIRDRIRAALERFEAAKR